MQRLTGAPLPVTPELEAVRLESKDPIEASAPLNSSPPARNTGPFLTVAIVAAATVPLVLPLMALCYFWVSEKTKLNPQVQFLTPAL